MKRGTLFLVNPAAGNGSTGSSWARLSPSLKRRMGNYEAWLTARPLDARLMAREALQLGFRRLVCVGGDGTFNEVLNGIMDVDERIAAETDVGFIPNGTGCDLAKSISVPRDLERAADIVAHGESVLMDIGRIRYVDKNGCWNTMYFHNIASLGLGGEVVRRVNRTSKMFGPFFSFIWATLITLFTYEKKRVAVSIDGSGSSERIVWHIAVANGQFQGGGMWIAPDARVNDGLLDVTIVGELSLTMVLANLHNLYTGRIYGVEGVTSVRGRVVEVSSPDEVFLDVDGEEPGKAPVRIEIVPGAIKMLVEKP